MEVEVEQAHAAVAAFDATVEISPAILASEALDWVTEAQTAYKRRATSSLSKEDKEFLTRVADQSEEFLAWLAQQHMDFENFLYLISTSRP